MRPRLSIIAGIFISGLLLLYGITFLSLRHFSEIEREEIIEDLLQADSLIRAEVTQLLATAGDYAGWDDTYRFVKDKNQAYIIHSLGDSFYTKQRLDLFCIINLQGEILYSRSRASQKPGTTIPPDIRRQLFQGGTLLRDAEKMETTKGFITLPDGVMMIAASPILTTESRGPSRGAVIIGRMLDAAEISSISKISLFDLGIETAPEQNHAKGGLKDLLHETNPVSVKEVSGQKLRCYGPLKTIYGQTAGRLYIDKSRRNYQDAKTSILALVSFSSLLLIAVGVLILKLRSQLTFVEQNERLLDLQLRVFVEMAIDAILRLDRNRCVLTGNRQALQLTGFSQAELAGMPLDALAHDDGRKTQIFDEKCLHAGEVVTSKCTLIKKGGIPVPVIIRLKRLPDESIQCIIQDLTEQAGWEKTLHQHQELLNGILNGTNDIIYAKDTEGRYLLINHAGIQFSGKTREEIVDHEDSFIFPLETAHVFTQKDKLALDSKDIVVSEDAIVRPDGGEAIFLSTRGRLTAADGQVIGMFATLHDITVKTKLEHELLEQHNRLGQMALKLSLAEERERVRIAEDLHDQIGPTLLLGKMKLDMLKAQLQSESFADGFDEVDELIAQAVKEIRSLTMQLRPPILANAGLESALKWLAGEFQQKYDLNVAIYDDGQQKPLDYEKRNIVFQAARELLLNVVKHSGQKSAEMRLEKYGSNLRMTIEDRGNGISSSCNESDAAVTSGFGLFNMSQKVRYLHGSFTVCAAPVKGTVATLSIPLDQDRARLQ